MNGAVLPGKLPSVMPLPTDSQVDPRILRALRHEQTHAEAAQRAATRGEELEASAPAILPFGKSERMERA